MMRIVDVYNEDVVIETNSSRRARAKSIHPELKLVGYHSMGKLFLFFYIHVHLNQFISTIQNYQCKET